MIKKDIRGKKRVIGWIILILGVILYLHFQVLTPMKRLHSNDFKHLYLGAKILRQGENPYNDQRFFYEATRHGFPGVLPYVYLPFTGLILSPLTFFKFRHAALIFFFMNHLLIAASIFLIFIKSDKQYTIVRVGLWIFYLALFYPLTRNLTAGQLNIVLLFCFICVWRLIMKKKNVIAGIVSAFAALFKLSPGILYLYFLWRKRLGLFLKACMAGTALLLISIIIFGPGIHLNFIPVMKQMSYGKSTWEEHRQDFYRDPANQSFNSFFHHILTVNPETEPWIQTSQTTANRITILMTVIITALTLMATFPGNKAAIDNKEREKISYSLFIMLSLLIPSLLWDHYFVQALLPIIFLTGYMEEKGKKLWCIPLIAALIFLAAPWNFWSGKFRRSAGILLMSVKLWAGLVIYILLLISAFEMRFRHSPEVEE